MSRVAQHDFSKSPQALIPRTKLIVRIRINLRLMLVS